MPSHPKSAVFLGKKCKLKYHKAHLGAARYTSVVIRTGKLTWFEASEQAKGIWWGRYYTRMSVSNGRFATVSLHSQGRDILLMLRDTERMLKQVSVKIGDVLAYK
jgi:hypothetical protein